MTNKDKCFLSYIAGLVDGEGCISIDRVFQSKRKDNGRKITYKLSVRISMSDPIALCFLKSKYSQAYLSGHNRKEIRQDGTLKKPYYTFELNNNKAYYFLKEIRPYIINKREQLDVAISFYVYLRRTYAKCSGRMYPQAYWIRQEKLYEKMKELHRKPYKEVKTVEPLFQKLELRQYCAKREDVEKVWYIVKNLLESAETKLSATTHNKAISASEQDIVQKI